MALRGMSENYMRSCWEPLSTCRRSRMGSWNRIKGASEEIQNKFFKEVLVLEDKPTDVDRELIARSQCGVEEVGSGESEADGVEVFGHVQGLV